MLIMIISVVICFVLFYFLFSSLISCLISSLISHFFLILLEKSITFRNRKIEKRQEVKKSKSQKVKKSKRKQKKIHACARVVYSVECPYLFMHNLMLSLQRVPSAKRIPLSTSGLSPRLLYSRGTSRSST